MMGNSLSTLVFMKQIIVDISVSMEFVILSDGTLCMPNKKGDSYKRVNDNTWGYFAGNVEDYMIMDENGNISEHFYINDSKNKGIDQGGIIYTKLSE